MSVAEMKAELTKLTAAELVELEVALQRIKSGSVPQADMAQVVDSLIGAMKFGPGWDEPLPLEDWDALRDNPSA